MRSGRYKETTPFRIPACDHKQLQDPPGNEKGEPMKEAKTDATG